MIAKNKVFSTNDRGPKKKELKNHTLVITDINKILAYSARKSKAKRPPRYSILNPETSSDSPSAKSKGARFVSAIVLLNHTTIIGIISTEIGKYLEYASSHLEHLIIKAEKSKIKSILTS